LVVSFVGSDDVEDDEVSGWLVAGRFFFATNTVVAVDGGEDDDDDELDEDDNNDIVSVVGGGDDLDDEEVKSVDDAAGFGVGLVAAEARSSIYHTHAANTIVYPLT
jgi:hypothetical protein